VKGEHLKLKVLFFGATADEARTRSTVLEMPAGTLSSAAFQRLVDLHPGLKTHKLHYSINQEYANGAEALKDGDELAVFTAVSGG
jgi:molybdopterin converting factor small subunit